MQNPLMQNAVAFRDASRTKHVYGRRPLGYLIFCLFAILVGCLTGGTLGWLFA